MIYSFLVPVNLIAKAVNQSAINVTWQHPHNQDGITRYDVEIKGFDINRYTGIPKDGTFAVFSNLRPYTTTIVEIRSCDTSDGCERTINTTVTTLHYRKPFYINLVALNLGNLKNEYV